MKEKWNELKEYLEGLGTQMPEPFFRLAEILQLQVFELYQDPTDGQYRIPYMMNDALEYFLILKNSVLTGEYEPKTDITSAQISQEAGRYTLILHLLIRTMSAAGRPYIGWRRKRAMQNSLGGCGCAAICQGLGRIGFCAAACFCRRARSCTT